MKKLNLDRKDLFNVKIQDSIDEYDLFYEDVMVPAAYQLNIILENCYVSPMDTSNQFDRKENPNNILAFVGDRGQGKTSTMLTFEKQLIKGEQKLFGDNIIQYHFESLGIIDPSTFEEGSNVLEIILGRMYRMFVDRDQNQFGSGIVQKNLKESRKELIDLFKRAYNYLSVLSDKKAISKDSIYEQSLDNLLLLGDSTSLKVILLELINKYLNFMNYRNTNKKNVLIITIDDLDLDISHSYEIIEQIRKYLILPNVIILLSTKIEQLHRGIRREYSKYLNNTEDDNEDAYKMATTYLRKMIPESRRLFLPNLRSDVEDLYIDKVITNTDTQGKRIDQSLDNYAIELIYKKTGIYLINYGNRKRYLLSGNLREYLELISFLSNLEDLAETKNNSESNTIALKNLIKFREFFVYNWCSTNLTNLEFGYIKEVETYSLYLKNRKIINLIQNILSENGIIETRDGVRMFKKKGTEDIRYSIDDVQKHFDMLKTNDYRIKMRNIHKLIYSFQLYYTILLHQLLIINDILELDNSVPYSAREINYASKEIGGKVKNYKISGKNDTNNSIFPVFFACEGKMKSKNEWEDYCAFLMFITLLVKKVDTNRDMVLYSYDSWLKKDYMLDFNDIFFRGLDIKYSTKLLYEITKDMFYSNSEFIKNYENSNTYKKYAKSIQKVSEFILCNFDVYNFYYELKDIHVKVDNLRDKIRSCLNSNKMLLTNLIDNTGKYFNLEMMSSIKNDIITYMNFLDVVRNVVDNSEEFNGISLDDIVINAYHISKDY